MYVITPNWPAPKNVKAVSTTRLGGTSLAPFDGLNLGTHVGDDLATVKRNRQSLSQHLSLPSDPLWLEQTHSIDVVEHLDQPNPVAADGAFTKINNKVCVVMTADCLPLLLTNKQGDQVAAVHAGWRGMADGIIEQAVATFHDDSGGDRADIIAWAGPCIGKQAFEVGLEVKQELGGPESAYQAHANPDKTYADLPLLAQHRLEQLGVNAFFTNQHCTFDEADQFFSYRRDGQTGRMATLIWFE